MNLGATFGTALIYISLALALISVIIFFIDKILAYKDVTRHSKSLKFILKLISIILFIVVTNALLLLYVFFITSNIDIKYVWEYSSKSLPMEYKISAVLAGMGGSLLFWIWCICLSLFVEEVKDYWKPKDKALMGWTRAILMSITSVFLLFLLIRDIFGETPQSYLTARPDGLGLNPLLQTPLMIVHPPIVFLAYGFMVICFASAMAYLICNHKDWVKLSMPWSRWAWFFLTLGIGIGGLWAYVVLGWGGYWAWDPVETSSLLPWILLTALLHAQLMFKRKGDYKLAAPTLGIYSFVLVIFATFTTRAGGIWESVHAFGDADVSTGAFDRFVEVLTSNNIILGYFILMVGLAIIGTLLLIWALLKRGEVEEDIKDSKKGVLEEIINDKNLMFLTLILLTITTIVTIFLLILSVDGTDRAQFDTKVGFFAMIGIVVLVACLAWKYLGRKNLFISLIITGVVSIIMAGLFRDHWVVGATIPFLILATGATLFKTVKSINKKSLRATINGTAPHIVHLGVVFIIIGFVGSNFLVTEEEIFLVMDGQTRRVGDYEFKLVDSEYSMSEEIFVTVEISKDGEVIGTAHPGALVIEGQWRNEIDVKDNTVEDVYLVFLNADLTGTTVNGANIQVKILPLMKVLWIGMWLMVLGLFMRIIAEFTRPKRKVESRVEKRARIRAAKEKDIEYYEDLIEKELEDME